MLTKLALATLAVLLFQISAAQNQKEVYGSFTAGCRVFNYHFKQAANHINALSIDETGQDLQLLRIEQKKLDTTLVFLKAVLAKLEDTLSKPSLTAENKAEFLEVKKALANLVVLADDMSGKVAGLMALPQKKSDLATLQSINRQLRLDSLLTKFHGESIGENIYTVSAVVSALDELLLILENKKSAKYTYFNEFNQEVFEAVFLTFMQPLKPTFSAACPQDLQKIATQAFYQVKARLEFFDDEPVTAYLKLRGKLLRVYISNENTEPPNDKRTKRKADKGNEKLQRNKTVDTSQFTLTTFKPQKRLIEGVDYLNFEIDNITAEFEDGNIKNLYVDLTHLNKEGERGVSVRFRNNMPISISNKFDPDHFGLNKIFAGNPCHVYRMLRNRGVDVAGNGQVNEKINATTNCADLFFLLSDLMDYLVVAENDKEDYSPANQVYHLSEQNPVQQLKKEKRSKILMLKAYSDFVGIQDDQPNGLIQFEASRRINILTHRRQISNTNYKGYLTYIEPRIIFSKLEQNNKYLYLDRKALDSVVALKQGIKSFEVQPLQILQYANFSIQTDFNIYKLNWSAAKSNFQFNMRLGYYRTAVSDSIGIQDTVAMQAPDLKTGNINSRLLGASVLWEFKPDSRYGLSLGYDLQHITPFSDNYQLAKGYNKFIHSFQFDSYINTNNDGGRLFFRTRFNQAIGKWNQNFMQIQLGYAISVFKSQ